MSLRPAYRAVPLDAVLGLLQLASEWDSTLDEVFFRRRRRSRKPHQRL